MDTPRNKAGLRAARRAVVNLRAARRAVMNLCAAAVLATISVGGARTVAAQDPNWSVNPNEFAATMSVTSVAVLSGDEVVDENDELAAFVNGQVRGVVKPIDVGGRRYFFLTVFGQFDGERVSFRLHRAADNSVYDVFEMTTFRPDLILGTTATPFLLTVDSITGVEEELASTATLAENYPEPVLDRTTIGYSLSAAAHARLEVFNVLGQRVRVLVDAVLPAGSYEADFIRGSLPPGLYVYRFVSPGVRITRTMVLAQ